MKGRRLSQETWYDTYDNALLDPLKAWMQSARHAAPVTDELPTFNDFGKRSLWIDFIFARNARALAYRTLVDSGRYGVPFLSDHNPVTRSTNSESAGRRQTRIQPNSRYHEEPFPRFPQPRAARAATDAERRRCWEKLNRSVTSMPRR